MFVISPDDHQQACAELEGRHHPHYRGTAPTEFGNLVLVFVPFTGDEDEPALPADHWHDRALSPAGRQLLAAEYDEARSLWRNARYVLDLQIAATGCTGRWTAYTRARQEMDDLAASLASTPDTQWRSTVYRLITAQDTALAAATAWDRKARGIADVHAAYLHGSLTRIEAAEKAGLDPAWVVGSDSDYSSWDPAPLTYPGARRGGERQQPAAVRPGRRGAAAPRPGPGARPRPGRAAAPGARRR
ncbi:hypothetical protein [Kitasatospora sp. NPDC059462]|uniref:hypothetical protein n=1 Tax=Kitasatospora sp. NPDC059462 TaxID=3346841 RepID=UPI0036C395C7